MHFRVGCLAVAIALVPLAATAQNQAPSPTTADSPGTGVNIELNKIENVGTACRGYFIVRNGLVKDIKELQIEVFVFGQDHIIRGQFSLVFPDIRAQRNKVVIFDFGDYPCSDIANFLVNEVTSCLGSDKQQLAECRSSLSVASRTSQALEY